MINTWDGLVNDALNAYALVIGIKFAKDLQHVLCFRLHRGDESPVCESLMAVETMVLLVGWQQGIKFTLLIEHQGIVLETVAMIVHIAAVEEEGAILRLCNEPVPFVFQGCRVSDYFEHPMYFKNSL